MIDENKLKSKINNLTHEELKELAYLKLRERELNRIRQLRKKSKDKAKRGIEKNEINVYI